MPLTKWSKDVHTANNKKTECSRILNRCMAMLTAAIECSRKLNNSMAGQTECMPQELSS